MKLRYTIDETSKNGSRDTRSTDFDKDEVIIGRGSGVDIHIDSRFLSLRHAKLSAPRGKLMIDDLGSLSGVRVNNQVTTSSELTTGDVIKLGEISFEVFDEAGIWGLKERRVEKNVEDIASVVERQFAGLQIANRLPSFRTLSLVLAIAALATWFAWPITSGKQTSWSSGPISNNHSLIAANCEACHSAPFRQVQDQDCKACHQMENHTDLFQNHPGIEGRCASCHMEHNGDHGLVLKNSQLCISCHGDVKAKVQEAKIPNIPDFAEHPQFRVRVQPVLPGGEFQRVSLDDPANLKDNSNVKLNHEKHLISIRGPKGKEQLKCRDCHEASDDQKTIKPMNFEKHCERCHPLGFDERLPERQVPHGDAKVVYKYLYAEYAKLFLSAKDDVKIQQIFNLRFRPGSSAPETGGKSSEEFTREFVEQQSRKAEQMLFTKTACYLCHRVSEKTISLADAQAQGVTKYEVLTPQIPDRWMPASTFDHGAHEEVQCEDCHGGVRQSNLTNHVLLPKVQKCKECHAEIATSSKVGSPCISCHSYHDPLLMGEGLKRSTLDILDKPLRAK